MDQTIYNWSLLVRGRLGELGGWSIDSQSSVVSRRRVGDCKCHVGSMILVEMNFKTSIRHFLI